MRLRVLGCSGGISKGLRTTSLQVDDDILIDAGSGVGDLELDEMCRLRHVFLTHSHMDHFTFLPLLIDTMFPRIDTPLIIHGLEATLAALQKHIFNWTIWPDFGKLPNEDNPVMRYEVMSPGDVYLLGDRKIEMIEANHIVPCVSYRVESPTGSFAFSGDTTTNDTMWDALNAHDSLDMLIVEAAFPNSLHELSKLSCHYTASMLAEDIKKLKHNPAIYISHPKPGQESTIIRECKEAITDREISPLMGGEVFTI